MNTTRTILHFLENYNALIKYHIKAYKEGLSGERKICVRLFDSGFPGLECFKSDILDILHGKEYPQNFVILVNRLYLIAESNSDLLAIHNPVARKLFANYPFAKELEQLSFGIYEFFHNEVFDARDEYERPVTYKGFDDILTGIPEYLFKDDLDILWEPYRLLISATNAMLQQKLTDLGNMKVFLPEAGIYQHLEDQKSKCAGQIMLLSESLCDRNFIFKYLQTQDESTGKDYLAGCILSDMFSRLDSERFSQYVEFDYSEYPAKFDWQFEKRTLKDYPYLTALPDFERLANLLSDTLFLKELVGMDIPMETEQAEPEPVKDDESVGEAPVTDNPDAIEPVLLSSVEACQKGENPRQAAEDAMKPETKENNSALSLTDELPLLREFFDFCGAGTNSCENKKPVRNTPAEYVLPVPVLDLIYQEFNDELWNDITLVEFLNMFTTGINKTDSFKLKSKQTTRFYYLLKKIWINSSDKALFNAEKEWIVSFLENYNLSYSAYANQFIKNEGGLKHRKFIKSVDKILPKDKVE